MPLKTDSITFRNCARAGNGAVSTRGPPPLGEHAQVARVCTKSGQFSQPCWAVVWRADHLLSGRCKKAFEFASKRLKTSENIAQVVHGGHSTSQVSTICAMQHGGPKGGVKPRAGNPRHDRVPIERRLEPTRLGSRLRGAIVGPQSRRPRKVPCALQAHSIGADGFTVLAKPPGDSRHTGDPHRAALDQRRLPGV